MTASGGITPSKLYQNVNLLKEFHKMGYLDFFIKLNGYSDDITLEFSMNMRKFIKEECMKPVRGVVTTLIGDFLSNNYKST